MRPEDLIAKAEADEAYAKPTTDNEKPEEPETPIYVPDEIACSLTLDATQARVLLVVLHPFKDAEEGDWAAVRAAADVRRRVAEATGLG